MLCYTQYVASFFEDKGLTKLTLVRAANRALGEDYNDLSIPEVVDLIRTL
jgi:hypothetical protein